MAYTQINPATGKKFRLIGAPVVKKDAKALVQVSRCILMTWH